MVDEIRDGWRSVLGVATMATVLAGVLLWWTLRFGQGGFPDTSPTEDRGGSYVRYRFSSAAH